MRQSRITFADLLFYLILLAGPVCGGLVQAGPRAAAHVGIILLAVLSLFAGMQRGSLTLRRTPLDLPLALFFLIALLSFCAAVYPHAARNELLRLLACLLLFFFVVNTQQGANKLFLLCGVLTVSGGLHALFGLLSTATGSISLFFANHSHYAGHLEMLVWPAVGLAMSSRGEKRLLLFGMSILMAAAVIFSLSRGGIVGLAAGLCFYLAVFAGTNKELPEGLRLLAIFALLLLAVLAWLGLDPVVARMKTLADPLAADQGRMDIWQGTLAMIADRPLFGWGPGCFPFAFPAHQPDSLSAFFVNHAHNDYLELAAETGLLGLAAASAAAFILFVSCLRKLAAAEYRYFQPVGAGALAGCFSLLVHSATDFNFHIPANAMLFAVLAGIAVLAAEGASGQELAAVSISFGKNGRRAGPAVLCLAACFAVALALAPLLGAQYAEKAGEHQRREQHDLAAAALEKALLFAPGNADLLRGMGDLLMMQAWSEPEKRRLHLRTALDWHEKAIAACPVNGEYFAGKANLLGWLGRHGDAELAYKEALRLQPAYGFSSYQLASLCLRQGRTEEAFRHFRRFLELRREGYLNMVLDALLTAGIDLNALRWAVPAAASFRRAFAVYLAAKGENALALRELHLAFVLEPSEDNALAQIQGLRGGKDIAAALAKTEEHLRRFPQSIRLLEQKAAVLEQLGRTIEAAFAYRSLQQAGRLTAKQQIERSDAVRWCLSLARLHGAEGSHEEAIAVLEEGIRTYPGEAQLHYALGLHFRQLRRDEEAMMAFKNAALFAPGNAEYQYQLGEECRQSGLPQNAAEAWKRCLAIQPDAAQCRAALALLEQELGLKDELIGYEKGAPPKFADQEAAVTYWLHIAQLYAEKERPADAAAVLRRGIEKYQQEARLRYALAMLLREMGNEDEALEMLAKAVFLKYDNAEYRYALGEEYQRKGLRQRAAEEWRVCLAIKPDSRQCRNALDRAEMEK